VVANYEGLTPAAATAFWLALCACFLHTADKLVLRLCLCCACSLTRTLQEKEAALKQHIGCSAEATAAVQQQLAEAEAAQQALKEQVDKLEASQVCMDLTGWLAAE
jgi:hypothetical protein